MAARSTLVETLQYYWIQFLLYGGFIWCNTCGANYHWGALEGRRKNMEWNVMWWCRDCILRGRA